MRTRSALATVVVLLLVATLTPKLAGKFRRSPSSRKDVQGKAREPSRKHTGSVIGKVVDASGKPVASATVVLKDSVTMEPSSSTADKDGKYKFTELFPGDYAIHAEMDGTKSASQNITVSNDTVVTANLVISAKG